MSPFGDGMGSFKTDDLEDLIEVVIDKSGVAYTIQRSHGYIATLYSRDKSIVVVKRLSNLSDAKKWAMQNLYKLT